MNKFDGEHYWEIGKAEYPLSKIIDEIQKAGFRIEKTYGYLKILIIGSFLYTEKWRIKLCQKKIQLLA